MRTQEIDGHDSEAFQAALEERHGPQVIVANTVKGRGISFMEDRMEWHYLPLTEDLYRQAVAEIENEPMWTTIDETPEPSEAEEVHQTCATSFASRS